VTGIVVRLAGPLQSWGEHSTFTERDTLGFPTRSGMTGLLAAAQGIPRGASLARYDPLAFTVRVDRPGTLITDFHTVGGGLPRSRTIPTASGGRRPEGTAIVVTRRWYLADAVFTVAVEGPEPLLDEVTAALHAPRWQPYLGRRSCPPDQLLFLRAVRTGAARELRERVPLPARRPRGEDTVTVSMISEAPAANAAITELSDVPVVLGRHERRYRVRTVYQSAVQVPAALADWGSAAGYRKALHEYARRP
jgi:CRISPR system Cascade subunit CasD